LCLAIPARIKLIDGSEAEVEISGVGRAISLRLTPEAQVGDYVYVHTGFAISVVGEAEALETLRLLEELAESYGEDELFYTTGDLPATDRERA
jgi:hydrogenase expression/formation protein HypC